MAGTKREPREIAKERVNAALKQLRWVRDNAKQLSEHERRQILAAVQRELVSLDAVFRAPQDPFEYQAEKKSNGIEREGFIVAGSGQAHSDMTAGVRW